MHYTDIPMIETHLKRSLTTNEQAVLATFIPGIEEWIDRKCNTTFKPVSPTSRYYEGGESAIDVDPCTEITKVNAVQDDGTDSYEYTPSMMYLAYPVNENVKTEVRLRAIQGVFPFGDARVKVTAKFSSYDGNMPRDIQTIATLIATDILRVGAMGTGNLKRESLEGHDLMTHDPTMVIQSIVDANPLVRQILEQRREIYLG